MNRIAVQLIRVRNLDQLSEIHNGNPLGNMMYNQKIVRDEQVRNAELFLQLLEHVDDLRLN